MIWSPEKTGDGHLVRSCKILSEPYKKMHRLTRFYDRILQDKHSFHKNLTPQPFTLQDSYKKNIRLKIFSQAKFICV